MKSRIISEEETFKPIKLEIICETLEELQEFELRMALYRKYLINAANEQSDLSFCEKYKQGKSAPTGIGILRKDLHKMLGRNSQISNPRWCKH